MSLYFREILIFGPLSSIIRYNIVAIYFVPGVFVYVADKQKTNPVIGLNMSSWRLISSLVPAWTTHVQGYSLIYISLDLPLCNSKLLLRKSVKLYVTFSSTALLTQIRSWKVKPRSLTKESNKESPRILPFLFYISLKSAVSTCSMVPCINIWVFSSFTLASESLAWSLYVWKID